MAAQTNNLARFGTEELPAPSELLSVGAFSFFVENGGLRHLAWNGTEVVRGLSVAVRDANWSSVPAGNVRQEIMQNDGTFSLTRDVEYFDGALETRIVITANDDGEITATFNMTARNEVRLNRAGFSVLHPLLDVSGQPLTIIHGDGRQEITEFPSHIAPVQPALDIVGLRHCVGNVSVRLDFEGEIFEMEDQRNWSDASFKTYCRPLGLPFPYTLGKGENVQQAVHIRLGPDKAATGARDGGSARKAKPARAPDILQVSHPGGQTSQFFVANGMLTRFENWDATNLAGLARHIQENNIYLDAEIIIRKGRNPKTQLSEIAMHLEAAGITPRHVIALPEAYLKSHQPTGPWPDGPTPEDCADAASAVFPGSIIGVGMLTNFTELNRYPPANGSGTYITHGNAAIVHAADDQSVLETLEALPQVFTSGCVLAKGRSRRLGMISIGMRSNPYGAALNENPHGHRMTMTDRDPRQKGLFAAAYVIGVVATAAQAGIEAVALAAQTGPFGVANSDGSLRPVFHSVKALSTVSGRAVEPILRPGDPVKGLAFDGGVIVANCGLEPVDIPVPFEAASILNTESFAVAAKDTGWISSAAKPVRKTVTLAPLDCLFAGVV